MKLLLDTHALIWFAEDDARLSSRAREALADEANDLSCSVASIWEMAIKVSLGKLRWALASTRPSAAAWKRTPLPFSQWNTLMPRAF